MRKKAVFSFVAVSIAVMLASALFLHYQNTSTAAVTKNDIVVTNFQQDHGFVLQSNAGAQRDDRSTYALGEQSLRLTTEGDRAPVFTRKAVTPALNFTDRVLKVWVKIDGVDNLGELRISATGDDFRTWTDYWISGARSEAGFLRDNEWNMVTISPGQAVSTGSPDVSRVDSIQVRIADKGTGQPLTVWINSIALSLKNDRAIVTFAFDDGYVSDYSEARPILDRYHFPATSYVVGTMVGSSGRLSVEQLKDLQDLNGWDIASHSYTHSNLTARVGTEIENDLVLSKQFLETNGLYRGTSHFAYPHGEFDNEELRAIVQKHFDTARIAEGGTETLPPPDPYRLRVMMVVNTTTPAEVSAEVQSAIEGGDWLILVFHRIVESNADQDMEYLKSSFEQIVDDIASRGVDVLTVSAVHENKFR